MKKVAFMSMDVESYFDTLCLKGKKIDRDPKYNCASDIQKYVHFLNKHNIHGTFFVVADFIKDCKEYLLEAIKDGHEIGLHCLHHQSYKKMSKEQFVKEIIEAKEIVKKELGVDPVGFRFPCFAPRKELLDILKDLGFIYDSSIVKPNKSYKRIQGFIYEKNGLVEFAPNIIDYPIKKVLISGGGYCRFLKGKQLDKKIHKHIQKHDSFLVYFHPFEIHEGYLPVPWNILLAQKRYIRKNRETYLSYLDSLVTYLKDNGYEFSNMKEYALRVSK